MSEISKIALFIKIMYNLNIIICHKRGISMHKRGISMHKRGISVYE